MSETSKEIIECDEHTANRLLSSGDYVFLGNYVKERVYVDEGVPWIDRKMNYCLAKKKRSIFQPAMSVESAKTQ
ncbi:MAG: hypothetical protein ACXVP5_11805 [Tumebacillaceae bacterium]